MAYYDSDEADRAVRAYSRRAERSGWTVDQPSRGDTRMDGDTIIVANSKGTLDRYRVKPDGKLRRLAV